MMDDDDDDAKSCSDDDAKDLHLLEKRRAENARIASAPPASISQLNLKLEAEQYRLQRHPETVGDRHKIYNRYQIYIERRRNNNNNNNNNMANPLHRRESFIFSPLNCKTLLIEKYVDSGLYYDNTSSSYNCFSCEAKIFTTTIDERVANPMIEHIRALYNNNNNNCDFIKRLVAPQYVAAVHDLILRFGSRMLNTSDVLEMMRVNVRKDKDKDKDDKDKEDTMPELIEYPFERTFAYMSLLETGAFDPAELRQKALEIVRKKKKNNGELTAVAMLNSFCIDDDDDDAKSCIDDDDDDDDDELKTLAEQNQRFKDYTDCKLCYAKPAVVVNVPCGHCYACSECSLIVDNNNNNNCATCRAHILGNVQIVPFKLHMLIDNGRVA